MKIKSFIGIDVSKATLDICLIEQGQILDQIQTSNSLIGIRKAFTHFKKKFNVNPEDSCCCMGTYRDLQLLFAGVSLEKTVSDLVGKTHAD